MKTLKEIDQDIASNYAKAKLSDDTIQAKRSTKALVLLRQLRIFMERTPNPREGLLRDKLHVQKRIAIGEENLRIKHPSLIERQKARAIWLKNGGSLLKKQLKNTLYLLDESDELGI